MVQKLTPIARENFQLSSVSTVCQMSGFNVSATLNVFRLMANPQLAAPQLVARNFGEISVPFSFSGAQVKAVVLDKDNCFAKAHDDKVWPAYQSKWEELRRCYPGKQLLIVSNSAGTNDDPNHAQAAILEKSLGVDVLRHSTKKPGCHVEIMDYFKKNGVTTDPREVAVVGDRLFTDVLMANMMCARAVWISEGVFLSNSPICRFERWFYQRL